MTILPACIPNEERQIEFVMIDIYSKRFRIYTFIPNKILFMTQTCRCMCRLLLSDDAHTHKWGVKNSFHDCMQQQHSRCRHHHNHFAFNISMEYRVRAKQLNPVTEHSLPDLITPFDKKHR